MAPPRRGAGSRAGSGAALLPGEPAQGAVRGGGPVPCCPVAGAAFPPPASSEGPGLESPSSARTPAPPPRPQARRAGADGGDTGDGARCRRLSPCFLFKNTLGNPRFFPFCFVVGEFLQEGRNSRWTPTDAGYPGLREREGAFVNLHFFFSCLLDFCHCQRNLLRSGQEAACGEVVSSVASAGELGILDFLTDVSKGGVASAEVLSHTLLFLSLCRLGSLTNKLIPSWPFGVTPAWDVTSASSSQPALEGAQRFGPNKQPLETFQHCLPVRRLRFAPETFPVPDSVYTGCSLGSCLFVDSLGREQDGECLLSLC